jgi:hypothetical protein
MYFASYRRRRRLAWTAGCLAAVVVVALLVKLLPSPSSRRAEEELQPGAPQVYKPPKPVRLTGRTRRQLDATVDEFVRSAVLRHDLERSWQLASPALRIGITRREWVGGDLPVYPYPADPKRTVWDLDYADAEEIALNVTLVPRKGEHEAPEVFGVSLAPAGHGAGRHWLVASWYPRGAISQPQPVKPGPTATHQELSPEERAAVRRAAEGQIDPIWWLLPGGVLALIVLGPLGYFAVMRLRRAYSRQ